MRIKLNNLLLVAIMALISVATAQTAPDEWEYLVVSYGTTYFSNPLQNADAENATFSKLQLFSEIGVTLPQEAITLQRNIDVLGMFGWEMVTVVGSIGGDQQIVFKRPYDAERSATEVERIKAERDKLIALYNDGDGASHNAQLVDLDALERAQAINARNAKDEATVRKLIESAVNGFLLPEVDVSSNAYGLAGLADVTAKITLDVTASALIAPGQYRSSLVKEAAEQFKSALIASGLVTAASGGLCGLNSNGATDTAHVTVTAIITHDDTPTVITSYPYTLCFKG